MYSALVFPIPKICAFCGKLTLMISQKVTNSTIDGNKIIKYRLKKKMNIAEKDYTVLGCVDSCLNQPNILQSLFIFIKVSG